MYVSCKDLAGSVKDDANKDYKEKSRWRRARGRLRNPRRTAPLP